jgi:hypothetical protein
VSDREEQQPQENEGVLVGVIGYKGFDENLRCCGFQYEIGGEYQHDGKVEVCEQGFHFCENPLDVLNYYAPGTSRFAKVEGSGDTDRMPYEDSKVACSHLKVVAELTLTGLIHAGVEFVVETAAAKGAAATTDYGAHAVTTGPGAHAATTGNGAHAATTDYDAHAATTGVEAHAATTGPYAHAATTGCEAHAATTGNRAHAATTDCDAHAATTGGEAHAATTGPYAHAVTTGPGAHAVTTGYRAHAVTAGDSAHAVTAGDSAHAVTAGNRAHAATTGYRAHAVTADDFAHTAAMGKESIAAGLGVAGRAKGALGCWLVLAEYKWTKDYKYRIAAVEAAKVDGKRIKPDTWYALRGGRFVEVVEDEE